MGSVRRYDAGSLRPARFTEDGRALVDGHLTRTGVFVYRNPDGSERREYRPPTEVFAEDSLASFEGVPVTDDHPTELLSAANARKYAVGSLTSIPRKDGDHVAASMVVFDAATIAKMRAGKVELSCGYDCDLVVEAGTSPQGERYDAIQTRIRGNHVAIVDVARAGRQARVRMDGATMVAPGEGTAGGALANSVPDGRVTTMADKNPEKKTEPTAAELVNLLGTERLRADGAEAKAKDLQAKYDEATAEAAVWKQRAEKAEGERRDQGEIDRLNARIAELEEKFAASESKRVDAESPDRLRRAVRDRIEIEMAARQILGGDRFDELSDRELMVAVCEKRGYNTDSKASDEFVKGTFRAAVTNFQVGADALARMRQAAAPEKPAERIDARTARERMIEENQNAWRRDSAGGK